MSAAQECVDRFQQMWWAPTPEGFTSLFHPDRMFRHPSMSEPPRARGAAAYMSDAQAMLPTISATISDELSWDGADRFTLCDGRAVEAVAYFDTAVLHNALVTES